MAKSRSTKIQTEGPIQVTVEADGLSLGIDATRLPQPTTQYTADWAAIEERSDRVNIYFGQVIPMVGTLGSILNVYFTRSDFKNHFFNQSRKFHESVKNHYEKANIDVEVPNINTDLMEASPPKSHLEQASINFMAFRNEDAEISFYYISPQKMHLLTKNPKKLTSDLVRPIVVIILSGSLLLYLLNRAEEICGGELSSE